MSSRDRLLLWLAVLSAAGYLALTITGDLRVHAGAYLTIHAVLFVLYLAAIRSVLRTPGAGAAGSGPRQIAIIVVGAVVFRLLMLPAAPSLSDDIWRYIWEGGVQLHGINPYRYVPSAVELAPYRDRIYDGVNYKDLPAIYPPLTQWAFALGALLGRSAPAMKTIFVAADIALVLLLIRLLLALRMPAGRVLIYAWNPLVVVEIACSGHNDSLALCLLVASMVAILASRRLLSIALLGLSALAKLYPILLLPLYAKKVRPAHLLVAPVLMGAAYLPYLSAGENLFRSAREYAERWRFNDSIFSVMVAGVDATGISPIAKRWADARGVNSFYTQPHLIAREVSALLALGVLVLLAARLRRDDPFGLPRGIYLFTGLTLLLQPALHPWYLLWIVPWLVVFPSPAWLALCALMPLSYLFDPWVRWLEYVPFFGLLLCCWISGRRRSVWRRASRLW